MTDLLVCLASLAMELFVFVAWYGVWVNPGLPVQWQICMLGAVTLSAYFLTLLLGNRKFSLPSQRLILAAWILFCLLITLKVVFYWESSFNLLEMLVDTGGSINTNPTLDKFFHLIFVGVLAIRGSQMRLRPPLDISSVQQSFQIGVGALLIFALFYGSQFLYANLLTLGGFLLFSLLALSLARLTGLKWLRGGRIFLLNKRWGAAIILGILFVTAFALAAGWLGGGRVGIWITRIFQWFLTLFFGLFTIIFVSPMMFFLEWVFAQLSGNLEGKPGRSPYRQTLETLEQMRQQWQDTYDREAPENTAMIWMTIGILLVVVVGSLLLLKWKPWKRQGTDQADFESSVGHSPIKLLADLLRSNFGMDRKRPGLRQMLGAARIYQIYRQLLHHCDMAGLPKPPASTPLEFLPKMQEFFTGANADLDIITAAFLNIRYGELPESPEEVQAVINAWERIKVIPHNAVASSPSTTTKPAS